MKIAIVGHFKDNNDEGVRIVANSISKGFINKEIITKEIEITSLTSFKEIIKFDPDIIHFVMTPTLSGLIISKLLSITKFRTKTIISAIHPFIPKTKLLFVLRPELTLIQSFESEELFKSLGFKTKFVANGVDTNKFVSVDSIIKSKLRKKYGILLDKFVLLHLASMTKERNLEVLIKLQKKEKLQVLIVGREHEIIDKDLLNKLKNAGCIVWIKHFSNIEEIYQLSDCYIFPTINKKACIELPLSVLEAMSCNLPVISTKFGALTRLFRNENGFFFIEDENQIYELLLDIINENIKIQTRNLVLDYSWDYIIEELIEIYQELLN